MHVLMLPFHRHNIQEPKYQIYDYMVDYRIVQGSYNMVYQPQSVLDHMIHLILLLYQDLQPTSYTQCHTIIMMSSFTLMMSFLLRNIF